MRVAVRNAYRAVDAFARSYKEHAIPYAAAIRPTEESLRKEGIPSLSLSFSFSAIFFRLQQMQNKRLLIKLPRHSDGRTLLS